MKRCSSVGFEENAGQSLEEFVLAAVGGYELKTSSNF